MVCVTAAESERLQPVEVALACRAVPTIRVSRSGRNLQDKPYRDVAEALQPVEVLGEALNEAIYDELKRCLLLCEGVFPGAWVCLCWPTRGVMTVNLTNLRSGFDAFIL